jgi:peptidoglycan/LPS O-acetylase OafA/YrhL
VFRYWGEASYALYMTHLLLLPLLHRVVQPEVAAGAPWPARVAVLLGYAAALAAAAAALHRLVEVPSRRALRAGGAARPAAAPAGGAARPATAPAGGAARPSTARAGR